MSNLKNEDLVNTAEILSNAFLELSQSVCAASENLKKTVDYLQKLDKDKNNNFEKSYTTLDVDFDRIIERIKENEEKRNSMN